MAHTRCMLDKEGYMHARSCTRPRVRARARKHKYIIFIDFTLYVHCLSCLNLITTLCYSCGGTRRCVFGTIGFTVHALDDRWDKKRQQRETCSKVTFSHHKLHVDWYWTRFSTLRGRSVWALTRLSGAGRLLVMRQTASRAAMALSCQHL